MSKHLERRQLSSQSDSEAHDHFMEPRANSYTDSVRERDLDHFLIEELQASPDFRAWFVGHLGEQFKVPPNTRIRTQRSPSRITDGRQTDVWLAYRSADEQLVAAVLVECKVADGFQRNQAEDYAREVAAWRVKLGHRQAASILVAPRNNLRLGNRELFDGYVSIDDMAEVLKARRDRLPHGELRDRLAIRVDLLEALAGKRPNSQWNPQPIAEKVGLGEAYDRLVRHHLPGFIVNPSVHGPHSGDRFFPGFPGRDSFNRKTKLRLKHRLYEGKVRLEFLGGLFTEAVLSSLPLPPDGSIESRWGGKTKETLQLQIDVPRLAEAMDASLQEADIVQGLRGVRHLANWFSQNVSILNQIIAKSRRV